MSSLDTFMQVNLETEAASAEDIILNLFVKTWSLMWYTSCEHVHYFKL